MNSFITTKMALIYDSVVTYIVDNSVKSAGSSSVKSLQGVGSFIIYKGLMKKAWNRRTM